MLLIYSRVKKLGDVTLQILHYHHKKELKDCPPVSSFSLEKDLKIFSLTSELKLVNKRKRVTNNLTVFQINQDNIQ